MSVYLEKCFLFSFLELETVVLFLFERTYKRTVALSKPRFI